MINWKFKYYTEDDMRKPQKTSHSFLLQMKWVIFLTGWSKNSAGTERVAVIRTVPCRRLAGKETITGLSRQAE